MEEVHPERCAGRASVPRAAAESTQDYGEGGWDWQFDSGCLQFSDEGVHFV